MKEFIFMKLGQSQDVYGNILSADEVIRAYIQACETKGFDYTWFSTRSFHSGMAKRKVMRYNHFIEQGAQLHILFAIGEGINEIRYSAVVLEIVSCNQFIGCPAEVESIPNEFGRHEQGKVWLKLTSIREVREIRASDFVIMSTGANLKEVISNSQYHYGYVARANKHFNRLER